MSPVETLEKQYLRYRKTKAPKDLAPVFMGLAPQLMSAARRAGLDQHGAEDAIQETFLAFIAGEERFEEGRPMVPWVRGIALRQINAARRRQARLRSIDPRDSVAPAPEADAKDGSEAALERVELRRKIEAAIRTLSEGNQQVVTAALFEGSSIEEISERFNLSRTATSVRLHRGLSRLRKKLGERSALGLVALSVPRVGETLPASALGGVSLAPAGILAAAVLAGVCGVAWLPHVGDRVSGVADSTREAELASATSGTAELLPEREARDVASSPGKRSVLETAEPGSLEASAAPGVTRVAQGIVRSVSGQPALGGAEIFALQTNPEIVLPTAPLVPIAHTGPDGSFSLNLNANGLIPTLTADASPLLMVRLGREIGWLDVTHEALMSGRLPEIHLEEELELNVTIKDELGRPLEGVNVTACSDVLRFLEPMGPRADEFGYPLISNYQHLFSAVTDEQGSARVGGLFGGDEPSRMVIVSAKKPGYARAMSGYLLGDDGRIQAEAVLRSVKSLHMEGAVQSTAGEPLDGVELRVRVRGEAPLSDAVVATSDAMGRWEIPQHLLDEFPLYLALDRTGYTREEIVVKEASELDDASFSVQMSPAEWLRGVVLHADQVPAAGAEITVATVRSLQTMTAKADGSFECSVPAGADRSVTVICQNADSAAHSVRLAAPRGESWLSIDLPEHAGVVSQLEAQLKGPVGWSSASLVPADVAGAIAPIQAQAFDGAVVRFESVPHGRWVLCGMTEQGASVVTSVDVGSDQATSDSTHSISVRAAEIGGLDCVIDSSGDWAALSGGDGACEIVASHRGLPSLPASEFQSGDLMEPEFFLDGEVGSPLSFSHMLSGTWQIFASGSGWATLPTDVVITPGGEVRVDLEPVPAATVQLDLPLVVRSSLLRFSIRRSKSDEWTVVAIPSLTVGKAEVLSLQLPEGRWLWRAEFVAGTAGEEFSDIAPPLNGQLEAIPGEVQTLRLLDGLLAPY